MDTEPVVNSQAKQNSAMDSVENASLQGGRDHCHCCCSVVPCQDKPIRCNAYCVVTTAATATVPATERRNRQRLKTKHFCAGNKKERRLFQPCSVFAVGALCCLLIVSKFGISNADSGIRWISEDFVSQDFPALWRYENFERNVFTDGEVHQRDKRASGDSSDERFLDFRFGKEPGDLVVARDESARLDCSVSGPSSGQTEIYWQRNGASLKVEDTAQRLAVLRNGSLLISRVIGARGQEQSDDGTYQCFASVEHLGKKWVFFSRKARLQVAVLPRFEEQPRDRDVSRGDTLVIPCRVDAVPAGTVEWYKDNVLLNPSSDNRFTAYPLTGSLEIRSIGTRDEGSYKCKVTNPDKYRYSTDGRIIVIESQLLSDPTEPQLEVQPKGQVLNMGETAVFECASNGFPEPKIRWLKDQDELNMKEGRIRLVGQGTLVMERVRASDAGVYTCRSVNSEESVDASASLEVQVPPQFTLKPKNVVSEETVDIMFKCDAEGFPGPNINWFKNGELIRPSQFFVIEGTNLRVLGLIKGDQGVYQCLAENEAGSAQSSAQLIVETAEYLYPLYSSSYTDYERGSTTPATPRASDPSSPELPDSAEGTQRPPPPSEPLNLRTTLQSSRSVSLRWDPPIQTNGDILAYSVYYKLEGSDRERVKNTTRLGELDLSVSVLQPDSVYNFRVVAYNKNGPGLSSAPIKMRTKEELAVPGKVKNLGGFASSSSSIEVRWDPPETDGFSVTYYRLFYSKSDYVGSREAEDETEIQVSRPKTSYVLHGLEKFTAYSFRVEAHSENGAGLPSETIVISTYSDVPSAPPENLSVEPAGAQSVAVSWEPPPEKERNGVITGYKVRYKERKRGSKGQTLVTDGNTREHTVNNLQSGTTYQFRIQAITVNGTGPGTDWIRVTTYNEDKEEEQVPGAPTSLRVQSKSDRIMISWTPPLDDGIMIRGYLIGWGINVPDVKTTKVDGNRRYHTITGLRPNRDYVVSLRTYNSMGNGFPIYETVRTLHHGVTLSTEDEQSNLEPLETPVGLRAYSTSATTIRLTWTDLEAPERHHGEPQKPLDGRYYTVRFTSYKFNGRSRYINASETAATVEDLQPNTQYEFSVRVGLGRRTSEWSMAALNTTKSAQPSSAPRDLTAALSTSGDPLAVLLNWQPPQFANGQIEEYLIYYTYDPALPDSKWKLEGVRGDRLSTTVEDLLPHTLYHFKIQARNHKGYGPLSALLSYRTSPESEVGDSELRKQSRIDQTLLIMIGIAVGTVIAVLLIIGLVVYCCKQRWSRNRAGYVAGKKSYVQKSDHKPPPDLWIGLAQERTTDLHQGSPSTSMQDLKHTLSSSPEPPRYHSLSDSRGVVSDMSGSVDEVGRADSRRDGTLERRRVGRAKPILIQRRTGGSDTEGGGTLTRSYHQQQAPSSSSEVIHPPASSRQRTPQVVYTGPRNQQPARTTVALESPYGSGNLEMTPTPPPQLPNGAPPAPPSGAVHSEGVRTLPRSENPLKSFTAMAAPPPHMPPGGVSPSLVAAPSPRTHMVRPVPITVVASPHRSIGTTPGGKPAGIVIGTRAGQSPRSVYSPRLQNYAGNERMSDTGKETDNELPHSYSTEELNHQIENLDTLMEDLQSMSKNEFNVV